MRTHAHTHTRLDYSETTKSEALEAGPSYVYFNKPTGSFWCVAKIGKTRLWGPFQIEVSIILWRYALNHLFIPWLYLNFQSTTYATVPERLSLPTSNTGFKSPFTVSFLLVIVRKLLPGSQYPNCVPSLYMLPNLFSDHIHFFAEDKTMTSVPQVKDS